MASRLTDVIRRALNLFPLDARSRRALDETLGDWTHESEAASGSAARAWVSGRAIAAIVRALARVALTDSREIVRLSVVARLVLFLAVPCALFALASDSGFEVASTGGASGFARLPQSWAEWVILKARLSSSIVLILAPLSLFMVLATTPLRTRVPSIGLALATVVLAVLVAGWIAPNANQHVREATYSRLSHRAAEMPRWSAEMRPAELWAEAWRDPGRPAMTVLLVKTGLVAASFAFVLLGGAVAALPTRSRRRWMLGVAVAYLAPFVILLSSRYLGDHNHPLFSSVIWVAVALAMIALWHVRRQTPSVAQLA